MVKVDDITKKFVRLMASHRPKQGGLSYRLEGIFQVITALAPELANRQMMSRVIVGACKRFNLGQDEKKAGYMVTNRFAAAALDALAKVEADAEAEV
ncbi:hypothetical protein HYS79_01820 [Patescibacteria group bacterium]|nr:hypothetical protein [Patescibacteria group bacterium]